MARRRLRRDDRRRGRDRDQPALYPGRGRRAFRRLAGPVPAHRAAVAAHGTGGGRPGGTGTRIVLLGPPTEATIGFAELLAHGDDPPDVPIDPGTDLALLPYSSGTSGLPKGVMLTHRACVANVLQLRAAIPSGPGDRMLAVAPFFHAVGFSAVANVTVHAGAIVVTMPRFDLEGFLGAVQEHRISSVVVVPPIVLALARHPAVDRYDLSSLRWVVCAAAPLGAELQQACARRLGRPVLQGYGMTEVTAGAAVWDLDTPVRHGAAGRLCPACRPGSSTRSPAPTSDRTRPVSCGCAARPPWRATCATRGHRGHDRRRGLAAHGDIARIDGDGALFVVDRLKELIKVKGFQVAPAELEAVLRTHPGVPTRRWSRSPMSGRRGAQGLCRAGGRHGHRRGDHRLCRRTGRRAQAAAGGRVH